MARYLSSQLDGCIAWYLAMLELTQFYPTVQSSAMLLTEKQQKLLLPRLVISNEVTQVLRCSMEKVGYFVQERISRQSVPGMSTNLLKLGKDTVPWGQQEWFEHKSVTGFSVQIRNYQNLSLQQSLVTLSQVWIF